MEGSKKIDFKVVLLGMSNVGKTCIFQRFLYDRFSAMQDNVCFLSLSLFFPLRVCIINFVIQTIGSAYGQKRVTLANGKEVTVSLWDTAGSERYESMARMYYKGASVALVCYGMSCRKQSSFF